MVSKLSTIITFLLLVVTSTVGLSQNIDIDLLREININRNVSLDKTFKAITDISNPISISSPILIYGIGWILDNEFTKRKGIKAAGSVLLATAISTTLKYGINRERPFISYVDIIPITPATSPSFPSGHTTVAFATATSLSLNYPRWYVIAPAYLWAGSVGYSRMHLGVHYPSDVLAGILIGSGSAYLSHYLLNKYFDKRKETKTTISF